MNTGGNVGGLIAPILTPVMAEHPSIGWSGSIAVACVISGIGGLVWLFIVPPASRHEHEREAGDTASDDDGQVSELP